MPKNFNIRYSTALEFLATVSDGVYHTAQDISKLEQQVSTANTNLNFPSPKAIKQQLSNRIPEIEDIVSSLHQELEHFELGLAQDSLSINSLAKALKVYNDIFAYGHRSSLKSPDLSESDSLPNLAEFLKVFSWLDQITQQLPALIKQSQDTDKKYNLTELKNSAQHALEKFKKLVIPVCQALQNTFVDSLKRNLTICDKKKMDEYSELSDSLNNNPALLSKLGIGVRTQRLFKTSLKNTYIQNQVSETEIKSLYNKISKTLRSYTMPEAKTKIISILESSQKRPARFRNELARVLSYQINKSNLTIPQLIIQKTQKPEEEDDALIILLALKTFGVKFDGRNQDLNSPLHLIKPWQKKLAQFLCLLNRDLSKTPINKDGKTPFELFTTHVASNEEEPFFSEESFVSILNLLSPGIYAPSR